MNGQPQCPEQDELEEVRARRIETLRQIWHNLADGTNLYDGRLVLSEAVLAEVVQYYLSDLAIIKKRYNIHGRIKRHKIAGLMTAAILRFRPIQLIGESYENDAELYANEFFALIHALSVCGEKNEQMKLTIVEENWFPAWLDSFMYLLHHRNYTSESLIMIFETICHLRGNRGAELEEPG